MFIIINVTTNKKLGKGYRVAKYNHYGDVIDTVTRQDITNRDGYDLYDTEYLSKKTAYKYIRLLIDNKAKVTRSNEIEKVYKRKKITLEEKKIRLEKKKKMEEINKKRLIENAKKLTEKGQFIF